MQGRTALIIALVAAAPVAVQAQTVTPKEFVAKAGASDMYEKQSSTLILQSTHNRALKTFADDMIRDHTKSTNMVKAAAMRDRVMAGPPHLMPEQVHMLAQLRAAHGPARDALYISQQKEAHAKALDLMQGYSSSGSAPALRHAAGDIAPVVQHHIDMLSHI